MRAATFSGGSTTESVWLTAPIQIFFDVSIFPIRGKSLPVVLVQSKVMTSASSSKR